MSVPKRAAAFLLVFAAVAGVRALACAPMAPGVRRAPPESLGEGAEPERLRGHVRHLCDVIGRRGAAHPEGMRRAADYIEAHMRASGAEVRRQAVPVGSPPFVNLIVRMGPPNEARFVVGAHYDSWMDSVGADDNASGVAGLLELARLLGTLPSPPAVELVAYAMEEPPFFRTEQMGSAVHARSLRGEELEVRGMVALEMIGFFSHEEGSQDYPSAYLRNRMPSRGDYIAVIGRSEDEAFLTSIRDAMSVHAELPVYGYAAPPFVTGIDFSDHRSYWPLGIPAAMVTDTAFLRNHAYHSHEDTADRLDYRSMGRVVDGIFSVLVSG